MQIDRKLKLVGGEIEITLYEIDESHAELIFADIEKEGKRLEKIFNFFDKDSELSALNRKRKLKVSDELVFVIKECIPYCKMTHGKYDITKGKQIVERKKGKELSKIGCSYKDIYIQGNVIELKHDDVLIDLGSSAKGYIGDKIAELIKDNGIEDAYIDMRGDIIVVGDHLEKVDIQHPREKGKTIYSLDAVECAVATSGDYMQTYGGGSHIIGQNDIISATVISKTLLKADIIATCLMVAEKEDLKAFKDRSYLSIDKDLNIRFSEGFDYEDE